MSFNYFSGLAFCVIVSRRIGSPCMLAHLQVCVFEGGECARTLVSGDPPGLISSTPCIRQEMTLVSDLEWPKSKHLKGQKRWGGGWKEGGREDLPGRRNSLSKNRDVGGK